jgi:protease I
MPLHDKTILFFAGPLYEDLELWYPKIRLEEEGASTVVAGTGEKTYQGKRGYPISVDTSVEEISAAEFDGLVIPGGYAPDIMRRSKKLLQLTREIYEAGKPVAFICHAGWVPISAGIVRGKRGTSVGAIKDDLVADSCGPAAVHEGIDRGASRLSSGESGGGTGRDGRLIPGEARHLLGKLPEAVS